MQFSEAYAAASVRLSAESVSTSVYVSCAYSAGASCACPPVSSGYAVCAAASAVFWLGLLGTVLPVSAEISFATSFCSSASLPSSREITRSSMSRYASLSSASLFTVLAGFSDAGARSCVCGAAVPREECSVTYSTSKSSSDAVRCGISPVTSASKNCFLAARSLRNALSA